MFGANGKMQDSWTILDEHEIVDGVDELGVFLFGHEKNAYWYGSQLSIEEARKLAPYQSATGLQVTSAVLTDTSPMLCTTRQAAGSVAARATWLPAKASMATHAMRKRVKRPKGIAQPVGISPICSPTGR
jgi:hypothetical protein